MRNVGNIIRTVAYLAILAAIVMVMMEVFRPKDSAKRRIDGFGKEARESLDVVCVGSSHAFCTWNPPYLYKQYGIRSCVYGSESQPIEASLAFIERMLKRQKPKLVFLESFMFSVANGQRKTPLAPAHRAVDSYPYGLGKVALVESLNPEGGKECMYLDFRQYHSRWKTLGKPDFAIWGERDCCHGCQLLGKIVPIKKCAYSFDGGWDRGINAYLAARLDQINQIVNNHGAKLIVFTAPFNAGIENARFCKGLSRFLESRNITYLNLIDEKCGLRMDINTNFADDKDGHLNIYGMEKVMDYIGDLLCKQYKIDGVHDDAWNSDVAQYEIKRFQEISKWRKKKK